MTEIPSRAITLARLLRTWRDDLFLTRLAGRISVGEDTHVDVAAWDDGRVTLTYLEAGHEEDITELVERSEEERRPFPPGEARGQLFPVADESQDPEEGP